LIGRGRRVAWSDPTKNNPQIRSNGLTLVWAQLYFAIRCVRQCDRLGLLKAVSDFGTRHSTVPRPSKDAPVLCRLWASLPRPPLLEFVEMSQASSVPLKKSLGSFL
jgi:hypothetical protein